MFRGFREVREDREIRDVGRNSVTENLEFGSSLLRESGAFKPNPDVKPGGRYWNLAKSRLGIKAEDSELNGLTYAKICKEILNIKKMERDAVERQHPEMPKLKPTRDVETNYSQRAVMQDEISSDDIWQMGKAAAKILKSRWEYRCELQQRVAHLPQQVAAVVLDSFDQMVDAGQTVEAAFDKISADLNNLL